jgi:DNA-binding beta-propeller fold protein YncE
MYRVRAAVSSGLCNPDGVAFDSHGDLWVGDFDNNRVLEFTPPFSNGERASVVIGQPNFTASTPAETRTGLDSPTYVAIDSHGNLWVADASNNRVLEFTGTG